MGIIHKDVKGENIPNIEGETDPSPLFSQWGQEKNHHQSSRLSHRIRNKVLGKYWEFDHINVHDMKYRQYFCW